MLEREIEDIAMLAQRLHALRLTIERDSACLVLSESSLTERSMTVKEKSRARESRRGSLIRLGEDWSRVDSRSRLELDPALQRLNREEREVVLSVLQSLEQVLAEPLQRRQKARQYWLQAKMAMKMGSFRNSADSVDPKPEAKTTPTGDAEPRTLAMDLSAAYQAALLANDQRTGWAKLTASGDSKPEETKEIKEKESKEKKSESSGPLPSGHSPMPPALKSLRHDLAQWLQLDQDISVVQRRLAGIRDY